MGRKGGKLLGRIRRSRVEIDGEPASDFPPSSFLAAAGLLNIQSTGCEEEDETGKNGADE